MHISSIYLTVLAMKGLKNSKKKVFKYVTRTRKGQKIKEKKKRKYKGKGCC
jgi:hypothetical protein